MSAKIAQRRPTRATSAPAAVPAATERLAYSMPEVAAMIGVSFGHIRNEVRRGKLKSFRSGRRLLISRGALESYLA
jgi:excisionase family DNA binding protein